MKIQLTIAVCAALLTTAGTVSAQPWWDGSDRYRWRSDERDYYRVRAERDEYKEEFYRDGCKVKREWRRDGSYKEEVECERRR
jgi:hypothetical protein